MQTAVGRWSFCLMTNWPQRRYVLEPVHQTGTCANWTEDRGPKNQMTAKLKAEMHHLIASIAIVPLLAAWPFLSAFPVFSLMERTEIDISTLLNVIFVFTGFWSVAGSLWIMSWLTNGRVRPARSPSKMLVIGGYAALWTGLYAAAAMWPVL